LISKKEVLNKISILLQESDEIELVNRLLYNLPKKNLDYIKENNYHFSDFVNEAIEAKIKREKNEEK